MHFTLNLGLLRILVACPLSRFGEEYSDLDSLAVPLADSLANNPFLKLNRIADTVATCQ